MPSSPSPGDVVFLGFDRTQITDHDRTCFDTLGLYGIPVAEFRPQSAAAAQFALDRLSQRCDRILVHVDVDVIDVSNTPLSENDGRRIGLALDQTMADLARFLDGLTSALAATLPPVDGAVSSS